MIDTTKRESTIEEMERLLDRLFPICRSLTGDGLRETLRILREYAPLEIHEVPSGTEVFDWTIPPEWNIRDAYILDPDGRKIVDFHDSNLHVVSYSTPVRAELSLDDLQPHLHSLPDQPDAIPYLTSYYHTSWGFCITQRQRDSLRPGTYTVCIDSTLETGSMTYGDLVIKGESEKEILFATNICHPSLANHELCGPITALFLSQRIAARRRRYTYRFLFNPETIGAIAYLHENGTHLQEKLIAGFTLLCLGMDVPINYKRSRRGDTIADRIAEHELNRTGTDFLVEDFIPLGSDERQFCSPGFNLPVGSFRRGVPAKFPEYHTSLDTRETVSFDILWQNLGILDAVARGIEAEDVFISRMPFCEPQLGKRGLYRALGSQKKPEVLSRQALFLMNYADGEHSLCAIADKAKCNILEMRAVADLLENQGLLERKTEE